MVIRKIFNIKNTFHEEKEMQDIMLNQEKDKNNFYRNSTGQLSNVLFLANPSEHS